MFRRLSLGLRIGAGFGVLLVLMLALGGLAAWQMSVAARGARTLAQEYVPEVGVANEVERATLQTLAEVQAFLLTGQEARLKAGREGLARIKHQLLEAEELAANQAHLARLKENAAQAQAKVKDYEELVKQAAERDQGFKELGKKLDQAAQDYIKSCLGYLANQDERLKEEIRDAAQLDPEKLMERYSKILVINEVMDLGRSVQLAFFQVQAQRDAKIARAALQQFPEIYKKLAGLKSVTRQEVNLKQLDLIQSSTDEFKKNLTGLAVFQEAVERLAKDLDQAAGGVHGTAKETAQAGMAETTETANAAAATLSLAALILLGGLGAALVLGLLSAWLATRAITRPLDRITQALGAGSEQVASASQEVASAAQSLAEGTSSQASSLEETAASLEELTAMTRSNADHAAEAERVMAQAAQALARSGQEMTEMSGSMARIAEAGGQISKIVKSIDEIAFQTNLLALNAAVEAARAGEAGAGFAVVADEVRNLALRAAEAAKSTQSLVEGVTERIRLGSELVGRTQAGFGELTQSAGRVEGLIKEIAAASSEQAQGLTQINQAVGQMDGLVQRAAANAEESASAAEELSAQAVGLQGLVGELVGLAKGAGKGTAQPAPPAAAPDAALPETDEALPEPDEEPRPEEA